MTMINQIATVAIYVSDQKRAEEFWIEKVRFKVIVKHEMGNHLYWLEVAPSEKHTRIVLYPKTLMKKWNELKPSIVFECENVDETYKQLKEKGVAMGEVPKQMSWGKYSSFKDPDGNEFLIKT